MKMGFDERHLLLRLEADGNVSDNLSVVFTLDAIKQAIAGGGKKPAISRARTSGTTSTRTGGTSRSTTARQRRFASVSRSEEHTSELQSLMRISYAVFCLKKKNNTPHLT